MHRGGHPRILLAAAAALLAALLVLKGVRPPGSRGAPLAAIAQGPPLPFGGSGSGAGADEADAAAVETGGAKGAYAGLGARLEAAEDLARLGPRGAAALRAATADDAPVTRAVATLALLDSPNADEEDVRCVEGLLLDGDLSVRFAAGLALFRHDARRDHGWRVTLRDLTTGETLADGPEATDGDAARAISLALAADAPWAARRLFRVSPGLDAKAVRLLRAMIEDRDTRRAAFDLLGGCGARGVEALADLDLARFEEWPEHRDAAIAFLRLGCRTDEALRVLAENPAWVCDARRWAEDWRPVLPAVRRALSGHGPIPREGALRIVRSMGPAAEGCLPELYGLLGSAELAPLTACSFASIGPAAAPALCWLLAESERGGVCLLEPGDVPSVGPPVPGLFMHGPKILDLGGSSSGPEPRSRDSVFLAAAARIAPCDADLARAATRRLDDPDASVRETATLALSDALRVGHVAAEPFRERFVHDPSERVRAAAAVVLGVAAWGGRDDASAALAGELRDGDRLGKEYAARALAMAGEEAALVRALESESALTRAWAAAAIFDPQVPRLPGENEFGDWAATMSAEQLRRSRAATVIAACAKDPDPEVRLVAVGVIGRMPGYFRDTWERTLASAESDPDDDVSLCASVAAGYWEKRPHPWEETPKGDPPPGWIEELVGEMRGSGLPAPVDAVLAGAGEATRAAIAADRELLAFERWIAARTVR